MKIERMKNNLKSPSRCPINEIRPPSIIVLPIQKRLKPPAHWSTDKLNVFTLNSDELSTWASIPKMSALNKKQVSENVRDSTNGLFTSAF